jgi:hypothetical protein
MQLSVAFSAYREAEYHELQSETYALQRSPRRRRSLTQHPATTGRSAKAIEVDEEDGALLNTLPPQAEPP